MVMLMLISWCVSCQEASATTGAETHFLPPPLRICGGAADSFSLHPPLEPSLKIGQPVAAKVVSNGAVLSSSFGYASVSKPARTAAANPNTI